MDQMLDVGQDDSQYVGDDEQSNPYGDKRVMNPATGMIKSGYDYMKPTKTVKQINDSFDLQLKNVLKTMERYKVPKKTMKKELLEVV